MLQERTRKSVQAVIGLFAAAALLWAAFKDRPVAIGSGWRMTMGTIARIVVVTERPSDGLKAIEAAFEKIYDIEKRMSDYDPNSLLSKVNREAFESPVEVDAELFEVLAAAVEYSRLSEGAFDITVGPVVQIWRQARVTGAAPAPQQLEAAKERVGYGNLILDAQNRTVRFTKEGMFLDLGGIAKGYAVDKAVEILQKAGLRGGMVDIGGNIRCFGTPADGAPHWLIGLQDPASDKNILAKLKLDNRAVATSGDYRRFSIIAGQKHSHIIDPTTADSAQTLSSVTIIAPTAMQADALSTAVSVLGDKKGMPFIESLPDVEAILIPRGEKPVFEKTAGAGRYLLD
ncbi:MAG TPA: FAD:protein FMN transferase [Anaerohalosphaeraceae bacterium]|nr:FAD:protein FMN transferase [Anaerohalosphaeraceae bacterium]